MRTDRSEWHLMRSVEKKLIRAKVHGGAKPMGAFRPGDALSLRGIHPKP